MNLRSATAETAQRSGGTLLRGKPGGGGSGDGYKDFLSKLSGGVNLGQTLAVDDDLDDDEDEYGEEVRSAKKDQAITKYAINVRRQWVERKEAAAAYEAEDSDEEEAAPAASSSSNNGVVIPEGAAFVAVERFSGRRAGYVFKRGAKGIGYYADAGPWKVAEMQAPAGDGGGLVKDADGNWVPEGGVKDDDEGIIDIGDLGLGDVTGPAEAPPPAKKPPPPPPPPKPPPSSNSLAEAEAAWAAVESSSSEPKKQEEAVDVSEPAEPPAPAPAPAAPPPTRATAQPTRATAKAPPPPPPKPPPPEPETAAKAPPPPPPKPPPPPPPPPEPELLAKANVSRSNGGGDATAHAPTPAASAVDSKSTLEFGSMSAPVEDDSDVSETSSAGEELEVDDDAPATPSAAGPRKPSPISRAGMHRARAALLKKEGGGGDSDGEVEFG